MNMCDFKERYRTASKRNRTPIAARLDYTRYHRRKNSAALNITEHKENPNVQPNIITKLMNQKLGIGDILKYHNRRRSSNNSQEQSTVQQPTTINSFTFGRDLGEGAYAKVRLAVHNPSQRKMAVKTYLKSHLSDSHHKLNVIREIRILEKLNHPHIVKLFYKIHTLTELHLAMEFVNGTNLLNYLRQKPQNRLSEIEFKGIFRQVLEGINYCHSLNVAHRDIKLENILIDKDRICIIDFGFSTCDTRKSALFCGTPAYMAPEIVSNRECYGFGVDVWALGVLMYVLLVGSYPFTGATDKELYKNICVANFQMPDLLSEGAKNLIYKMLKVDPYQRPTLKELVKDKWILSDDAIRDTTEDPNHNTVVETDSNIFDSIVKFIQKKLGYTDSQLLRDLKDKDSRAFKMYVCLVSQKRCQEYFN